MRLVSMKLSRIAIPPALSSNYDQQAQTHYKNVSILQLDSAVQSLLVH